MSSCRLGLSALPSPRPPPPLSLPLSSSRWGSTAAIPPPTSSSSPGPCTGSAWSEHWDTHVAAPGRGGGAGVRETEARYIPVFWGPGRDSSGAWDGPGWRPEDRSRWTGWPGREAWGGGGGHASSTLCPALVAQLCLQVQLLPQQVWHLEGRNHTIHVTQWGKKCDNSRTIKLDWLVQTFLFKSMLWWVDRQPLTVQILGRK